MNINKLESKLDDALSKETTESLTNWLNNKRMEKKQLATEWLMIRLYEEMVVSCNGNGNLLDELLDEAKQMEKEQKQFMFECGRNFQLTGEGTFEEVYDETFKPE